MLEIVGGRGFILEGHLMFTQVILCPLILWSAVVVF